MRRREQEQGIYTWRESRLVIAKLLSFRIITGVYQEEYPASVDEVTLIEWFRSPFLGELKLEFSLSLVTEHK